jgi:hypothetical protein
VKTLLFAGLIFLSQLVVAPWAIATVAPEAARVALCQKDIEGTYQGFIGDLAAQFNLICLSGSQPILGIALYDKTDLKTPDVFINMTNFELENSIVVFANFALANSDRSTGSSKSTVAYIKLNLNKLLQHSLEGTYLNGTMDTFSPVKASRIQKFPKLSSALKEPLDEDSLQGSYLISSKDPNKTYLVFDILADTPVIGVISRNSSTDLHFTVGPTWTADGVFESVTAEGNGGEPDDRKMNYIRGRFLDQNHIEFYLISSHQGLQGPLEAAKDLQRFPKIPISSSKF